MNSLKPSNGAGKSIEKQYVDQLNNEIVEINQRLDVDEANILSNSEDVAYALAKNNVQDSRLEALENKQDYDINRLDVNTISGDIINATTITTTNFQTDKITADSLDLNGALNVDDINADTIGVDTLTANAITSTSVNAKTADIDAAEIDVANIANLTSTNVLTTDVTASGTANVNELRTNKLVTTDATTGTTDLTSIKFRNEQLITDLPNAFRYIKIPIIQNGYYGIEYISSSAVDPENKESFSVMVYQNNGTVMVSYSQNDVNVLHKFYYDSINKNLWIETTNDIDSGTVKWSSADTETHNLAEFYRDITIDVTQKEVFGQLVKRLHGWVLMGNHTVSYGMDIMGGLTADLLTPSQFLIPFQRFYPEGTPVEAIYTDLIGNLGVGRFETSGYYGTALNKVEALNRVKVEENKITWTLDTDYGWDNLIWENWGQAETIPYDIGLITTSNVWDRAVNDPFEPVTITLTIHNTVDGTTSTLTGFNFITLSDIPETGYTLQGFATEDGGTVAYNVGDRITEDTELWTVYQRLTGFLYNSDDDAAWANGDYNYPYNIPFINPMTFSAMFKNTSGYYTVAKLHFTVEMDTDLTQDYLPVLWPNDMSGSSGNRFGGEQSEVTPLGDNLYDLSFEISEYDLFPEFIVASFGSGNIPPRTYDDWADHYFRVRDDFRIELEPDTVELTLSAITDSNGMLIAPLALTQGYTPINLDSSFDLVENETFEVKFYGTDISTGDPAEGLSYCYNPIKLADGSWYARLERPYISDINVEQIKVTKQSVTELQTGVISIYE